MKNKAFTLVELLVVVLIIGILAAIAVPQYQKAVLKARFHTGMPIVESLYQAQQAYYLQHGEFATDIDDLDLSVPKDENCTKTQVDTRDEKYSYYTCSFGSVGLADNFANILFRDPKAQILYGHFIKDWTAMGVNYQAGKRYCFAKGTSKTALDICKSFGGEQLNESETSWNHFKID